MAKGCSIRRVQTTDSRRAPGPEILTLRALLQNQQDGVRVTASIGGSAEDLAGIVDCDGIRDGESGVGGS